jgi:hypothetical protein
VLATCIRNRGSDLEQSGRGNFFTEQTIFHLEIGSQYKVMGLGLFETVLLALVCDETRKPNWLPVALFDFASSDLGGWHFALLDPIAASGGESLNRWQAIWGYDELVLDPAHKEALIERDSAALEVFFMRLNDSSV